MVHTVCIYGPMHELVAFGWGGHTCPAPLVQLKPSRDLQSYADKNQFGFCQPESPFWQQGLASLRGCVEGSCTLLPLPRSQEEAEASRRQWRTGTASCPFYTEVRAGASSWKTSEDLVFSQVQPWLQVSSFHSCIFHLKNLRKMSITGVCQMLSGSEKQASREMARA